MFAGILSAYDFSKIFFDSAVAGCRDILGTWRPERVGQWLDVAAKGNRREPQEQRARDNFGGARRVFAGFQMLDPPPTGVLASDDSKQRLHCSQQKYWKRLKGRHQVSRPREDATLRSLQMVQPMRLMVKIP